jgi:hypothetical protein
MSETSFAIAPNFAGTARPGISLRGARPEQPAPQPPKPELPPPSPPDPDLPNPGPPRPEIPNPAPGFPDAPVFT